MKRILVTGASGFIGQHCLDKLVARDFEVHAVTSKIIPADRGSVRWHKANLLDLTCISPLISNIKPTHLLHLAWHVAPGTWASTGAEEYIRWVQSSLELITRFTEYSGERAVIAGSCTEYDWQYGYCSESLTPLNPNTIYGACKNSLQQQISAYSRETGLSSAWGRVFFLYGPFENKSRLVSSVINSILKSEVARCTAGTQIRDFLYVDDVADAFVEMVDSRISGPVNIASGRPVMLRDIIFSIAEILGNKNLVSLGSLKIPKNETPFVVADISRLADELGWQPKYDLDEGLNKTIEWWKYNQDNNE